MALSAMNKTSRTRREILKIEKSIPGGAVDPVATATTTSRRRFSQKERCLKFAL